ncbi:MAG: hypothetical protein QNJ00_01580 [Woeseiaceae bacterium]|nr:hypothetical protein [Woeseiaceae bacterium]
MHPATADVTVEGHVFSEVVHRGAALSDAPAAGMALSLDSASGWFAGLGGYYANGTPSGLALNRNVHGYAGWFREMGDEKAIEVSLAYNEFIDVTDWSYFEVRADYHLSAEASLTFAYSPDYYGRDGEHVLAAGTWRPALGERTYLHVSVGAGYIGGIWDEVIGYGEFGIGYSVGRADFSISFNEVDEDSGFIFATDRSNVAARVSYLFR